MLEYLSQLGIGPEAAPWWLLGLGFAAAALLVALPLRVWSNRALRELREEARAMQINLDAERRIHEERDRAFLEARRQLSSSFENLSGHALRQASRDFLQLAEQNLRSHQVKADSNLAQRQQAITELLKPIKDLMGKTERQIADMEKDRRQAYGALQQHLTAVAESQHALQAETRNLTNALRRPEVRGRWGEMTLRRLVEIAGMVEHCDFTEQESATQEGQTLRPDMVIKLPDSREIVVDVKTPLDAYLGAHEAATEQARSGELKRHARIVGERVRDLAGKAYWQQFKHSPDFVIMFIPGEQFLTAALDQRPELLEEAMRSKVILATPTSFIALLKAIAFSWRQLELIDNAQIIRELGETFYRRVGKFSEHFAKMGRSLNQVVAQFNAAAGSLDRQVLPATRRLVEMGITSSRSIEDIPEVDLTARPISEVEPLERAPVPSASVADEAEGVPARAVVPDTDTASE